MRLVKRLLLWTLCLCLMTSGALAMGLNVTQPEPWKLRVSWSPRLDVAKIVVYTGENDSIYYLDNRVTQQSVTINSVAPQGTYRIKAFDQNGKVVAEAGEVTGTVGKWSKYGAVTGICEIVRRTNSDESKSIWDVSHPTVNSITASELDRMIGEGIPFHLHWKVQFKQKSYAQTFRNDLVMYAPDGSIYVDTWDESFNKDMNPNSYWNCYPYVTGFDAVFDQYRQDHSSWQPGKYTFRIYADGLLIQDCTMTVK